MTKHGSVAHSADASEILKTRIAPEVLVSRCDGFALNTVKKTISVVPEASRNRVRELRTGVQSTKFALDAPLFSSGIACPVASAKGAAASVGERISQSLAKQGALAIMPTEKCNLRCTYCYEKFEKGRAPGWVVSAAEKYIDNMCRKLDTFSLSWFGGEPLLQKGIIDRLSSVFRDSQKRHGIEGSLSITTNGVLIDDDYIDQFNRHALDVIQISLDGPKIFHDRSRLPMGSFFSTYDQIYRNIIRTLSETDVHVVIRVNIGPLENRDECEYTEWLKSEIYQLTNRFAGKVSVSIVPVWDASTTSVSGICLTELNEISSKLRLIRATRNSHESGGLDHFAELIGGVGTLACYAGKPNNYVLGSDGSIYRCTVAFDLGINQIGKLNSDGNLEIDAAKEAVWIEPHYLSDPGCSSCGFRASCLGAHCPLTRMLEHRTPCPSEKVFFSDFCEAYLT